MEEEHKKYSTAELLIGVLGFLLIDLICIIIDLTGVGAVIAPMIQNFGTFTLNLWAWHKGDKNALKLGKQIAKYAANFLPLVPTLTIVFLITALNHNNPKVTSKLTNKLTMPATLTSK